MKVENIKFRIKRRKQDMHKGKLISAAVAAGLVFAILCSFIPFEAGCEEVKSSVLRLHVLANSDSAEDQALKLRVRDSVLAAGAEIFGNAGSLAEAEALARENIWVLYAAAERTLREEGSSYPVSVKLARTGFDTRKYDAVTLPAGEYDAVQVVIGEGRGKNWWCVMFPPLCLPAAGAEDLSDSVSEEGARITSHSERYVMKFKVVELYETLKQRLFSD